MQPGDTLRFGLPIGLLWLGIDLFSKWWIVHRLMVPPRVIPITTYFAIVPGRNTGVSFGMFSGAPEWLLVLLPIAIAVGLVIWMMRANSRVTALALAFILGGATGNIVDRLQHGGVTDFLDFHIGDWHWPAFNAADVAICLGVGLLFCEGMFSGRRPPGPYR